MVNEHMGFTVRYCLQTLPLCTLVLRNVGIVVNGIVVYYNLYTNSMSLGKSPRVIVQNELTVVSSK